MSPVGGLVSARGATPGDLAGTLGLEAALFCPKCDPSMSQWSFHQWMKLILLISQILNDLLFYLKASNLGLLSHLKLNEGLVLL